MPTEESNRFKAGDIDPILASVLARRLKAITEEMGIALLRTTRSPILNEARDFVTGLYDAQGRMLEQTEYIPVLAFALQPVCAHIMEYFAGDIHEGDVILHNDVFSGGNQNNDVAAFRPIFHQGRLFAWAARTGPQADIAAPAAGYNIYAVFRGMFKSLHDRFCVKIVRIDMKRASASADSIFIIIITSFPPPGKYFSIQQSCFFE